MKLSNKITSAIKKHMLSVYPEEGCGFVVGDEFVPITNSHATPLLSFRIDPIEYIKHQGSIRAVIHSHTYALNQHQKYDVRWPSSKDMSTWINMKDVPWGICACNGEDVSDCLWLDENEIAPLEGRTFIHGIHDCYAVIRDYFRLKLGITLMNVPRVMDWWDNGEDIYSQNFEAAGFVEIPRDEATINDCALFQVRSPVINHAAVITGNNEILHHLFHRLSGHDRLDRWQKQIVKFVRYQGKQEC